MNRHPLVGILVTSKALKAAIGSHASTEPNLHLVAARAEGVLAFYFSLRGVSLRKCQVRGWLHDQSGKWCREVFRLPDVVYVRRSTPRSGFLPRFNKLLRRVIPLNEPNQLFKWTTHTALLGYKDTAAMLPHAVLYHHASNLLSMLARYPSVYVKPDRGSGGKGIVRIWQDGVRRFWWQATTGDRGMLSLTEEQLRVQMEEWASSKSLIIQQEIPVLRIDGRRTDIRVVMQKDDKAQWQLYAYFRVGPQRSLVSNVDQGGEKMSVVEALRHIGMRKDRCREKEQRVHQAALVIGNRLQQSFGRMGEIGVDLALDRNYRVWIIEANARPGKSVHGNHDDLEIRFRRPFQYAKYLWCNKAWRNSRR